MQSYEALCEALDTLIVSLQMLWRYVLERPEILNALCSLTTAIVNIVIAMYIGKQTRYIRKQTAFFKKQTELQAEAQFRDFVLAQEAPIIKNSLKQLRGSLLKFYEFYRRTLELLALNTCDERKALMNARNAIERLRSFENLSNGFVEPIGTSLRCLDLVEEALEEILVYAYEILGDTPKRDHLAKRLNELRQSLTDIRLELIRLRQEASEIIHSAQYSPIFLLSYLKDLEERILLYLELYPELASGRSRNEVSELILLSFSRALYIRYLIVHEIARKSRSLERAKTTINDIMSYLLNDEMSFRKALKVMHGKKALDDEVYRFAMHVLERGRNGVCLSISRSDYVWERIASITNSPEKQRALESILSALVSSDFSGIDDDLKVLFIDLEIAMVSLAFKTIALRLLLDTVIEKISSMLGVDKEVLQRTSAENSKEYSDAVKRFVTQMLL